MKVLIVGKDSYIGNHIDKWLSSKGMEVKQLDVLTNEWTTYDYSSFDSIVHVAGIVHRSDCEDWELYKRVNSDMPIQIAKMAKEQGVSQYIFFSTMGVYGVGKKLSTNIIDTDTSVNPIGMYGRSKYMAEEGLRDLQDVNFNVVCIRPPSVYGKGCRGGYITGFTSIVRKSPVIPKAYTDVHQSFIYIDNLSELIRLVVEKRMRGVFCPQDDKSVNANELLQVIADGIGKKLVVSRFLGLFVRLFHFLPIVKKAYGGVEYSQSLSVIPGVDYIVVPFNEAMRRTVAQ